MNVSLYQAAAAMNANERWQEMVMENLSSSSVPGFKKQEITMEGVSAAGANGNLDSFLLPAARTTTNFEAGELRATGVNTDLALRKEGFFEVQMPTGETAYTRDGEFHVTSSGQLVTKNGWPVVGEAGPIQLDPRNTGTVAVGPDGSISQGGEPKGQLKVTTFNRTELLTRMNGSYFLADHPALQSLAVADPEIRQGFLESSNASPVADMSSLIMAMRSMESTQKTIKSQEDRMEKAISELGSPT